MSLIKDMLATRGFATCAVRHPGEFLSSVGPTMHEATFGLLGSSFQPQRDIPDLASKVVFVTGGNAGLGRETILQIAKHHPARIYMGARNADKARAAIASIQEELGPTAPPVDIRHIALDLASFASVRAAAAQIVSDSDRLDVLVLNAGTMGNPPTRTSEGYEIQFGTNHIGHFLLTTLLLPLLQQTAAADSNGEGGADTGSAGKDVRVITVASLANELAPSSLETMLDSEALLAASTWTRYGASKAANILFAAELARRFPQLVSVAVHPGVVKSSLYDTTAASGAAMKYSVAAMRLFFRSVRTGALNQLWAAVGAPSGQLVSGAYYTPVGRRSLTNKYSQDEALGRRLWEWTAAEIAKHPAA